MLQTQIKGMEETVPGTEPPEIRELLARWADGDREALRSLMPMIYDELRRVARHQLRNARSDHTLRTTALVHETYLRLENCRVGQFQNRSHFLAVCALFMRQILVGHERSRRAAKRGAGIEKCILEDCHAVMKGRPVDLLALDDALNALSRLDPEQGRIVELRFFGGLSIVETAEVLDISSATVKRHWSTARIWLYEQLSGETRV